MKLLILILSLTFLNTAFASKDSSTRLLQILIENSHSVKLVGETYGESTSISQLLSKALSAAKTIDHQYQVVTTIWGSCEDTTPEKLVGAKYEKCSLVISNGDYKRTDKGLVGPEAESSIEFIFELITPVVPQSKSSIKNKIVTVKHAG